MENLSLSVLFKICKKHNQPIQFYDLNGKNPQCQECLLNGGKLISFEQIQQHYQEIIINKNQEYDLEIKQLQTLADGIMKYKENIISILNKNIEQVIDQIKLIHSQKQSILQLQEIMNQFESIDDLKSYINNNQRSNIRVRNKIILNLLLELKYQLKNQHFLPQIFHQKAKQAQNISIQSIDQQKSPQNFEYELINKERSEQWIYDFALDKKNNTLIIAMEKGYIKIHDFQNGKLGKEIQILKEHTSVVYCLHIMKITECFVSGSYDNSIIIWNLDQNSRWKVQYVLKDHKGYINCITINSKEDVLISGSGDNTVKFWRKQFNQWQLSQTFDITKAVYQLKLNENEDKLIACGFQNSIHIISLQSNSQWKISQVIKVNKFGYRLCFTIKDQFVFQPKTLDYLEVYDFDERKQQFYQKSKIQVQSVLNCDNLFPCQYIKTLSVLTVKHGQFINIFKISQNGDYQLIQSIQYQDKCLYGRMTYDGEYLMIWDKGSQEIQVRKLKLKF